MSDSPVAGSGTPSEGHDWAWPVPGFRRFLGARAVSVAASSAALVTMPVIAYDLTQSPAWVSGVAASSGIPYLLFGLFAGAAGDAGRRRRIMVVCELAAAASIVLLLITWATGTMQAWHVLAVAMCNRSLFVFYDAANLGAVPSLVGRHHLPRAHSAIFSTAGVLEVLVPSVVGAAIGLAGAPAVLVVTTVLSATSAVLLGGLRGELSAPASTEPRQALWRRVLEGLAWLWQSHGVRTQTLAAAAQAFGHGAFGAMVVPWTAATLGQRGETTWLGVIYGAWGLGALVAARTLPRVLHRMAESQVSAWFGSAAALATIGTATARNPAVAVVWVTVWSYLSLTVMFASLTMRQRATPDSLLSRVNMAGRMAATGVAYPLGAGAIGVLGTWLGAGSSVPVVMVGVAVLACAVALTPSLRRSGPPPGRLSTR